jgi:hypothetical protein
MKAEISNFGSHREAQFTGVYQQQGRMLLDRDWNELCEILRDLGTGVSSQAIGTGVPRHGGLLQGPLPTLTFRPEGGLVAAGGVIGSAVWRDPEATNGIYGNQLSLPEKVPAAPVAGDPNPHNQPLLQGVVDERLLYVDIWDRTVTAFESDDKVWGSLIDPALHGADTCFRQQRMVQIKTATIDDVDTDKEADPCLPQFLLDRIPTKGDAVFTANFTKPDEADDPCDPCAKQVSIVRAVTNHLFRIEVHSVSFDDKRRPIRLVLKWSRENGARELPSADIATMGDPAGHSYEYFSDATERLLGMPSDDWAKEDFLHGVLDPADADMTSKSLPRAREWDGWCILKKNGPGWTVLDGLYLAKAHSGAGALMKISAAAGKLAVDLIDSGFSFTLTLAGKNFLAGDYWLALVRARAPADKRVRVVSATPVGVEHRYCILGVNYGDGEKMSFPKLSPHDERRLQHPSLTCLDASDIGYLTDCPSGLFDKSHNNVKKALDQICHIGAEHVAFAQPCKTSVYSQPAAEKIKTVADALKLLCDITAGQILYKPTCDTSIFSQPAAKNVKTVADALALLCGVTAEQIGFKPDCGYLTGAKSTTVKQALEALCVQPASAIPFDPVCDYLKSEKVKDVAAALEALCKRQARLNLPLVKGISWGHDATLPFSEFRKGISVTFSEKMAADFLSTDTFVITWEVPLTLRSPADLQLWEFMTPQIMVGKVSMSELKANFIPHIVMTDAEFGRIVSGLKTFPRSDAPFPLDYPGIRCRVRLIGRSVFDEKGERPLDGYVPPKKARGAGASINLDFDNAGLGHLSDFESWFYLVQG